MTVGGPGLFAGPIVGTSVLLIIPELLRSLREYVPFVFAGILLIVLFLMPQGLAGLPEQFRTWFGRSGKGPNWPRSGGA